MIKETKSVMVMNPCVIFKFMRALGIITKEYEHKHIKQYHGTTNFHKAVEKYVTKYNKIVSREETLNKYNKEL